MGGAHAALAWAALGATGVLLVLAGLAAIGSRVSLRAIDLAILVQLAIAGLSAVMGIVTAVVQSAPRDALHLVYGAVATGAPIAARAAAHRRGTIAIARWVAVGALVGLGATVRAFMTGT